MIPALAALLLAASPASPCEPRPGASDDRARACELLGVIDRPIADATWRGLGPEADEVLVEVARSADPAILRARALEGLAARGTARAAPLHRELAAARDAPIELRRAAIRGLERLSLGDADLAGVLLPLAELDTDGRVRAVASEVLARRAPATACAGIRARAGGNPDETVRLEAALASCSAQR